MSDVIGPSRYLPGHILPFKADGRPCDECDLQAHHAVIGETDSFGSEVKHLCSGHLASLQSEMLSAREQITVCEVCGLQKSNCAPARDPEEGTSGPVMNTCPDCKTRMNSVFAIGSDQEDSTELDIDEDILAIDEDDLFPPGEPVLDEEYQEERKED